MAGLGCIGKNNLVITTGYGPRIRFRALLLDRKAETTGPLKFNPCEDCKQPCRKACPVKAFQNTVYSADALGQSILPGINGTYDRGTCNVKMEKDIEESVMAIPADDIFHSIPLQSKLPIINIDCKRFALSQCGVNCCLRASKIQRN